DVFLPIRGLGLAAGIFVPLESVDLGGHDEVVLVEAFDFLGAQRHGCAVPTKADVGVVALGLGDLADLLDKCERLAEVPKPEGPLDATRLIEKRPVRRLFQEPFCLVAAERRDGATARGARFLPAKLAFMIPPMTRFAFRVPR